MPSRLMSSIQSSTLFPSRIAADLGMSARQIERILADMKASGIIRRVGANRNGHWEIVDD